MQRTVWNSFGQALPNTVQELANLAERAKTGSQPPSVSDDVANAQVVVVQPQIEANSGSGTGTATRRKRQTTPYTGTGKTGTVLVLRHHDHNVLAEDRY